MTRRGGEFGAPFVAGTFRGRSHPDLDRETVAALARCPELCDSPGSEVLLAGRNRVVATALPAGGGRTIDVVIKRFGARGLHRLKTLAVPSKAKKAWRGAAACLAAGVDTPTPIAFLERRGASGPVSECYFVSARVRNAGEIRPLFRELRGEDLRTLVTDVAAWARAAHDRGVLHRDLSDGNLLVSAGPDGRRRFLVIDTNRIRSAAKLSRVARLRGLVRLGVPAPLRGELLAAYFGRPCAPAGARRTYLLMKGAFSRYLGLKRALRLKAVARALRLQ